MYSRFSVVQARNQIPQEFRSGSDKAFIQCHKDQQEKKTAFDTKITVLFKSGAFFFLFAWLPRSGIKKSLFKVIKDSN